MLAWQTAWAQTTIVTPRSGEEDCETADCINAAKKGGTQGNTRTVPATVWQMNENAIDDYSKQANRSEKSREKNQRKPDADEDYREKPEGKTEFQEFVYRSTNTYLPVYGGSFFQLDPKKFKMFGRVPVPADYLLSTGDHLMIRIWGQTDFNSQVIVDRNGQIFIPKIGVITVIGVRYENLHNYLKNVVSRSYKNFDISVSLGQMRNILIMISGSVRHPGRYSVTAETTLANALALAGGPTANGSMRHIQLKRRGQSITEFDAYDLLVRGDDTNDVVLLNGDVIYIPPSGPQIAVLGSVNRPAIYELSGAITVAEQIEVAGGLSSTADPAHITLETIENHLQRKVEKLTLDKEGQARALQGGDVLRIFAVSPRFEDAVTLRGNVASPGRYPWQPGMRIHDLIPSRESIITTEYWLQQNTLGQIPAGWLEAKQRRCGFRAHVEPTINQELERADCQEQENSLNGTTAKESSFTANSLQGKSDEFRNTREPSDSPPQMRSLSEINWEYAVVQRLNSVDLTTRLLPFNLGRALQEPGGQDNLALESGDVVTIFSQRDLEVPVENRTKFVWVVGEVKAAGVYRAEPGETLRQIVVRAGGLTPQAYVFASVFQRESTRMEQRKELEHMLNDMDQEINAQSSRLALSGNAEERAMAREELEAGRSTIEKLKQTPIIGRIVLDLKPTDTDISSLPDLPLEDGDRITIPTRPPTVQVVGAVYNQSTFIYRAGKNVSNYLDQSGGATRNADSGRMFVVRADGSVLSKQMHRSLWGGKLESVKLMPGDTIVMPQRLHTTNWMRGIRDWSQVFSQFALGAAAIRVISP